MRALILFYILLVPAFVHAAAMNPTSSPHTLWKQELHTLNGQIFAFYGVRQNEAQFDNLIQSIERTFSHGSPNTRDEVAYILSTLYRSWDSVIKHTRDKRIEKIVEFLAKHHQTFYLEQLFQFAQSSANIKLLDFIYYEQALSASNDGQWPEALKLLGKIDKHTTLTQEKKHHATLLFGVALQKTRKHREAIRIYTSLPESSVYFHEAQLNLATAYIRQGWWTDAHIAIKKSEKSQQKADIILRDRMLMILGYSQFNKEFYRDARDTFRQIELQSPYADRALLGIGLSALAQDDHKGAINAFAYLTKQNHRNLSTDEAFLMLPYSYNKYGKTEEAAETYVEAIAHFNQQLKILTQSLADYKTALPTFIGQTETLKCPSPEYNANSERLNAYTLLLAQERSGDLSNLKMEVNRVKDAMLSALIAQCEHATERYSKHINSYINQSNYGLAKLYDQ